MSTEAKPEDRVSELATTSTAEGRGFLGVDRVLGEIDPVGFGAAVARSAVAAVARPRALAKATASLSERSARAVVASTRRALGSSAEGPAELGMKDRRYSDPAYTTNAWFYLCRQQHSLLGEYLRRLADEVEVDQQTRRKLDYVLSQVIDSSAPPNYLLSNPAAVKKAFDTGGLSLLRGVRNMARDMVRHRGQPSQVTPGTFQVGRELACTPGKVVYRNRLIELIQYEAQTDTVHEVPMLFSPPWINKYYIMDLAPGKSLAEWAVRHGHTCFMISYRNPDASLRDVGMSDYLREGPLAALRVIEEITGTPKVNLVGLCLGGTLATVTGAWLAARGENRINSLTLLNTLLDFSEPGQLGTFIDEKTLRNLNRTMTRTGYLPARSMKTTFDLLRATDLVWNYVANNWLLGEDPPPFDLLSWNSDSTRMPAAMHSEYLRVCYLENLLVQGRLELGGERIELGCLEHDSYVVTAEADHIAPWRSVYSGARSLGGSVRFALSNSGHIAGVVNPPSPKARLWVSELEQLPADSATWRSQAQERPASWWEDWVDWVGQRGGDRRVPPTTGTSAHPPLLDAPGSYVRG